MTEVDGTVPAERQRVLLPAAFSVQRDRLVRFGRRTRQVILLAAVTGIITGAGVALFEWITKTQLFERVARGPRAVQVLAPTVALVVAALILRFIGRGASPSTADEYIKNFHDPGTTLDPKPFLPRMLASVATLGLGGALGYEGPSIYLGAAVGATLQRRLRRYFTAEDSKVLLVAGAAAGVAAIFKAPATGLVFALEVPYQEDFARRMFLPAGIAAAASYVTFVAFTGTTPLFSARGSPPFDWRDLGGALVLGAACGIGARGFVVALNRAKQLALTVHPLVRALVAGAGLSLSALLSFVVFGRGLTLGAGYDNLSWAFDPRRAIGLVLLLFVLRALVTVLTVGGGGAGGLFIPLVIEGALLGRALGGLFRTADTTFFPLIGVSAFLGAGYRVPLVGVMFAAEASGRPGFIVPGLIAAVVAQLFMGEASASQYQLTLRTGHLERRLQLSVESAMQRDPTTIDPSCTVADIAALVDDGKGVMPVAAAEKYVGVINLTALRGLDAAARRISTVAEHVRNDYPTGYGSWSLREAIATMERERIDLLPIVDGTTLVGVVTRQDALRLDQLLGED